nr:unnamed protein product [Callosobruchus chinensis]
MAFPGAPLPPGLAQFDVMAASHAAAQAAAAAAAAAHAQQQASGSKGADVQAGSTIGGKRTSSPKTILNPPNATITSRMENLPPKSPKLPLTYKKSPKDAKNEKSLENAVEKLTQNRHKEIANKHEPQKLKDIPKPDENKSSTKDNETKNQNDSQEKPATENKSTIDKEAVVVKESEDKAVKTGETTQIEKKVESINKETVTETPRSAVENKVISVEPSDKQQITCNDTEPKTNCNAEKTDKHNSAKEGERVDGSSKTSDVSRTMDKGGEVNSVKKVDVINVTSDGTDGCNNKVKNSENAAEDGK